MRYKVFRNILISVRFVHQAKVAKDLTLLRISDKGNHQNRNSNARPPSYRVCLIAPVDKYHFALITMLYVHDNIRSMLIIAYILLS